MASLNGITAAVLFCIAGDTTSTESARYGWTTRLHACKSLDVHCRGSRRACRMEIWVSTASVQTRKASKKALLSSAAIATAVLPTVISGPSLALMISVDRDDATAALSFVSDASSGNPLMYTRGQT